MKNEYWIVVAFFVIIFLVLVIEGAWFLPAVFMAGYLTAEIGRFLSAKLWQATKNT